MQRSGLGKRRAYKERPVILWVDDDGPKVPIASDVATIVPARAIGIAEGLFSDSTFSPDGVILDLILPQGSWKKDQYLQSPGIAYAGALRERLGPTFPLAAYGICISPDDRSELQERGIHSVYEKTRYSLIEVARKILGPTEGEDGESPLEN